MKDLVLVVGASGTVGSELVRLLKSEGYRVRSTSSQVPKDVDTVQVNLATGEGVRVAFEGVDRAFLLSPPGYADHHKILSPLIQESKLRGLKKVILMTSMVADDIETSPFRESEVELEKSGLKYNIVRPNWFLQNFNTFWIQGIKEHGKILLPAGAAKASFIDAKDISAAVAKLIITDALSNRAFSLTGPVALDHSEVAHEISLATGKTITYQEIEPAVLKAGFLQGGVPEDYVNYLLLILGFLRDGYSAPITSHVREILGREPRGIKEYTQENRAAWL